MLSNSFAIPNDTGNNRMSGSRRRLEEIRDGYRGLTLLSCRYRNIVFPVCAPPLKLKYNVQSVDDSLVFVSGVILQDAGGSGTYGNVTQDGQQDVDEEISIAAALEEDT